jgi:hypothetical protein
MIQEEEMRRKKENITTEGDERQEEGAHMDEEMQIVNSNTLDRTRHLDGPVATDGASTSAAQRGLQLVAIALLGYLCIVMLLLCERRASINANAIVDDMLWHLALTGLAVSAQVVIILSRTPAPLQYDTKIQPAATKNSPHLQQVVVYHQKQQTRHKWPDHQPRTSSSFASAASSTASTSTPTAKPKTQPPVTPRQTRPLRHTCQYSHLPAARLPTKQQQQRQRQRLRRLYAAARHAHYHLIQDAHPRRISISMHHRIRVRGADSNAHPCDALPRHAELGGVDGAREPLAADRGCSAVGQGAICEDAWDGEVGARTVLFPAVDIARLWSVVRACWTGDYAI